jgi:hypothetical protein
VKESKPRFTIPDKVRYNQSGSKLDKPKLTKKEKEKMEKSIIKAIKKVKR